MSVERRTDSLTEEAVVGHSSSCTTTFHPHDNRLEDGIALSHQMGHISWTVCRICIPHSDRGCDWTPHLCHDSCLFVSISPSDSRTLFCCPFFPDLLLIC